MTSDQNCSKILSPVRHIVLSYLRGWTNAKRTLCGLRVEIGDNPRSILEITRSDPRRKMTLGANCLPCLMSNAMREHDGLEPL